jgi:hypothetical protein
MKQGRSQQSHMDPVPLKPRFTMPDQIDTARQQLEAHGGYGWLLSGPAFWYVKQVVEELFKNGRHVSVSTVTRWFHDLPHTQGSSGPGGLSASKNDLILFFAGQMRQSRRRLDSSR